MGALVPRGYGTGESSPRGVRGRGPTGRARRRIRPALDQARGPSHLGQSIASGARAISQGPRRVAPARGEPAMISALPPLISSDGHLEVRPERWTPRMPAKYRDHAPRTVKLPDGGDAILVEGQAPYPAPFLDLRAGRNNETWQPFGVTVDDTAGSGAAGAATARTGGRRHRGRGPLPQHAGGAASLARADRRRSVSRHRPGLQRLAGRGVLSGLARPPHRPGRHPVDQRRRCHRRAGALREARLEGRQPGRVPQRRSRIPCPRTIGSGPPPST